MSKNKFTASKALIGVGMIALVLYVLPSKGDAGIAGLSMQLRVFLTFVCCAVLSTGFFLIVFAIRDDIDDRGEG